MNKSDVVALVGKKVEGRMNYGTHVEGVVEEVKWKNVLISNGTANDWKWIPDIYELKEVAGDANAEKPAAKRKRSKRAG